MHITYDSLREFTAKAFSRAGLAPEDAATGAEALAMTDAWGVYTHGTKLLRGYLRRFKAGGLRAKERPTLAAEGLAWGRVGGVRWRGCGGISDERLPEDLRGPAGRAARPRACHAAQLHEVRG